MGPDNPPQQAPKPRLQSLDALRGLTIGLMLLVNNAAMDTGTPKQLMHAPWNGGVRLADLVFPWFLFCMGLALPFSMQSMAKRGWSKREVFVRILLRTAALFFLGCLIDSIQRGRPVLMLDVLQLLGLAYFFGSLIYPLRWQPRMAVAALLLAGYGAALVWIPVPSAGKPVFEETQNLVRHVNHEYLAHFNLSGLLSAIPTTALVLIGATLTNALRSPVRHKLLLLAGVGALLALSGVAWNEALPYNKTVWTPSYILLSAGLGGLLLAALYWLLDLKRWTALAYPLLVFGSNALVAYVAPILVKLLILQRVKVGEITLQNAWLAAFSERMGRVAGGWAYTLSYIAAVWLLLAVMYHKRWFVRV